MLQSMAVLKQSLALKFNIAIAIHDLNLICIDMDVYLDDKCLFFLLYFSVINVNSFYLYKELVNLLPTKAAISIRYFYIVQAKLFIFKL